MKRLVGLFALAALLAPAVAGAQAPPAAPAPPAGMRAGFAQMEQIHTQERARILASLSPAHRTLLANVAGQMAVADKPDPRAAAGEIEAALSPTEKDAVMKAHQDAMQQMRTAFEQMRSSMPSRPPSAQGATGGPQTQRAPRRSGSRPAPTAGQLVLMVATGPQMGMGPRGMHPGGPPPAGLMPPRTGAPPPAP